VVARRVRRRWLPVSRWPQAVRASPSQSTMQQSHGEMHQFQWQTDARNGTRPCHSN